MTELRLLGPVEALNGAGPIDLGGARPTRLLVALFTAERHRLDLDALVDRCFDDGDRPDDPVPAIRTAVRRLRRALGDDTVATRPGGYELDLRTVDVDLDRFDELIGAGRAAADPVAAITTFRRALDLWRGRPFGDLGEVDWLVPVRIRLEESRLVALEGWHDAHLRNGTATEIVGSLESATREHPLRERFHRQLMQALYVSDRQADALRAYQAYREAMAEAGLEPGPETMELEQRIVRGDASLKAATHGRPLRGYRIVERLGEGAFSIVYRGTQPSVDRDVAIKQIRAELANLPEFIRRFEAEAHMVAHLEHPFVVPLYDYWREPGSAYLVMRLLPGGSLESSLLDGPWSVDRVARMVEQVGAALSAAHRAGVVHRDVKPANILLDDEGNCYLTDFGIALAESELVDPEASLSAGSPAYASPEQLRREPVGPSADVHGLAIAVYEALTGRLPFPDEPTQAALLQRQLHDPIPSVRSSRTDVPVAVDDVLHRATAKVAADRYQTVDEFVVAFEAAVGPVSVPTPSLGTATIIPSEERNPYKGLRAFDEADAADFAGRERLVDQLLAELATNRFLAIVGPSGSGKSSAVRAGLLPALRRGAIRGSSEWFVATVMPGAHPDEELEAALLRVAADRPPRLIDVLRDGDRGISRALRQVLPDGGQLLLVIDQFEELFTLCDDEVQRRWFLDGLAAAVTEERSRLHVILTLRADFYDRPLRYEAIGRLVRDATVPVLPLAADELERAIVDPARSVGAELEPGLVSEIVADVADQPGGLPLLQYALTELYDRRVSNVLTRDAYRAIGGVTGALAARAEDLHEDATGEERVELRRLLGRLVTLGEGTEDTRRRVVRSELGTSAGVATLIDRFGRARLLSFDRDPVTREPTVEVAHEALLREWPRLRGWLDDDRDGLRIHRHLTDTTAAWIASGRDAGDLYRGGRLDTVSGWATDHGDDLNEAEREFLAASIAVRRAELAAEQERYDQQVRHNRRLRVLVGVTTVIAVVAAVAGVFALEQRSRADDEARRATEAALFADEQRAIADEQRAIAETQTATAQEQATIAEAQTRAATESALVADVERMRAQATAEVRRNPPLAALLAVEAYRLDASPLSAGAIQQVLTGVDGRQATLFDAQGDYGQRSVMSVDRSVIAVGSSGTVDVWDVDDRSLLLRVDAVFADFDMSSDGSLLAVGGFGTTEVDLIDVATGRVLGSIDRQVCHVIRFSPGGERLATLVNETDGELGCDTAPLRLQIYDVADPTNPELAYTDTAADIADVWWTPDGSGYVAFSFAGYVELRDAATNTARWTYTFDRSSGIGQEAVANPVGALFRTDGQAVVVAVVFNSYSGIRLFTFDAATGEVTREPTSTAGLGSMNWWDEEETQVVGTLRPSGVTVLDLVRAEEVLPPPIVNPNATAVYVDREHDRIVAPGFVGIEIFSLDGTSVLERRIPLTPEQLAVKADSDGQLFASVSADGTRLLMSVIDFQNRSRIVEWDLTTDPPTVVGDVGPGFAFGQGDSTVVIDFESARILDGDFEQIGRDVPLEFERGWPRAWRASADGSRQAPQRAGTSVIDVYDTDSGDRIAELMPPDVAPADSILSDVYSFSADGAYLLASYYTADGAVWAVFDTTTGDVVHVVTTDARGLPWLDGTTIYSNPPGSFDVERRDVETLEEVGPPLVGPTLILSTIVDDLASDRIVTQETNGNVRVWDRGSGDQIGLEIAIGRQSSGTGIVTARDGDLVGVTLDTEFAIWNYDIDSWPALACELAGRNMTRSEWEDFGPQGVEYRATCPQFPAGE